MKIDKPTGPAILDYIFTEALCLGLTEYEQYRNINYDVEFPYDVLYRAVVDRIVCPHEFNEIIAFYRDKWINNGGANVLHN